MAPVVLFYVTICACFVTTLAAPYTLPEGLSTASRAASWEFTNAHMDVTEWNSGYPEARQIEVLGQPEWLTGTLIRGSNTDNRAYIQTGTMNITVIDTTYLVVRMRHRTNAQHAGVWFRVSASNGTAADTNTSNFQEFTWNSGDYIEMMVPLASDSSWVQYAFPIFESRAHVPIQTLQLHQIRLFPALRLSANGKAENAMGTFDIDFIRLVHAPSIVKVEGCMNTEACTGTDCPLARIQGSTFPPNTQYFRRGAANKYYNSSETFDVDVHPSDDSSFPFSRTYGCSAQGGDRINITGFHFGVGVPVIKINSVDCLNVHVIEAESLVSCTLPALASQVTSFAPSMLPLTVQNYDYVMLEDTESTVSFGYSASSIDFLVTNVNAKSLDVNVLHGDFWTSVVTTGYRVAMVPWTQPQAPPAEYCELQSSRCEYMHFSNISVMTLRALDAGTNFAIQVCATNLGVGQIEKWFGADKYFQTRDNPTVRAFLCSPFHQAKTLYFDFLFARFDAAALLDEGPAYTASSLNSLSWAGGEGHYGLVLVGAAAIGNCNATHSCCDSYGGPSFAEDLVSFTSKLGMPPYEEFEVYPYNPHQFDYNISTISAEMSYISGVLNRLPAARYDDSTLWELAKRRVHRKKTRVYPWEGVDEMGFIKLVHPAEIDELDRRARDKLQEPFNFTDVAQYLRQLYERQTAVLPKYHKDRTGAVLYGYANDPVQFCQSACYRALNDGLVVNFQPAAASTVVRDTWRNTSTASLDASTGYERQDFTHAISTHHISGRAAMWIDSQFAAPNGIRVSTAESSNPAPSAPCGPALRLTSSLPSLAGAAWYARPQQVLEGFDTTFTFRMSNPTSNCVQADDANPHCRSRGGAGFAFVLSTDGPTLLGDGGPHGLGYASLPNTVAVEFDTFYNEEQLDFWENHVSVHFGAGKEAVAANHKYSVGHVDVEPDLTRGIHTARIVYSPEWHPEVLQHSSFVADGTAFVNTLDSDIWSNQFGYMQVFIDSDEPILTVPCDLSTMLANLEANNGRAWAGFTASTGARIWQTHDILAWHFVQLRMDR